MEETMRVVVPLVVGGIDLDNDATLETIGAHFSDALWSTVDGVVAAEIEVDAQRAVEEAVEFARRVECRIHGAKVRRVRRDLVSASDVAQRTGFSRESVRKWAASRRGFPAAYATVGDGARPTRVWLWHDVARWLHVEYAYPVDADWPSEATIAHIDAQLHRVPDYLSVVWRAANVQHTEPQRVEVYEPRRVIMVSRSDVKLATGARREEA